MTKIKKTFRLHESAVENIGSIQKSFGKDGFEMNDTQTVQYALSLANSVCVTVDKGGHMVILKGEDIERMMQWYKSLEGNCLATEADSQIYEHLKVYVE